MPRTARHSIARGSACAWTCSDSRPGARRQSMREDEIRLHFKRSIRPCDELEVVNGTSDAVADARSEQPAGAEERRRPRARTSFGAHEGGPALERNPLFRRAQPRLDDAIQQLVE